MADTGSMKRAHCNGHSTNGTMAAAASSPAGKKADDDSVNSGSSVVELKRTIGLFSAVGLILGTIVGSGIFVSPTGVLMESQSVGFSLIIWTMCGLLVLMGALCFAELGVSVTKSGGMYAYIQEAFGDCAGFLYMWTGLWIIFPAANAAIAVTCAQYLLYPLFPDCNSPEIARRLIAACAIALLTFVNCINVKLATRIQDVFTVIKTLALVVIIITGLVALGKGSTSSFENSFEGSSTDPGKISLAFYSGMFSYSGWYTLNFLTEELKQPQKNLNRAIWISIPLSTVIYVLTNIGYFAVLSPEAILRSEAVAVTFAERMFGVAAWIMPIFVAFSTFGTLNGCILSVSRIFFVGARQGHLPQGLALINVRKFTPVPAVLLEGIASMACLCIGDIFVLINCVSAIEALAFAVCMGALLQLRRSQPHLPRPIKVHIALPIAFMLINLFMLGLALWEKPYDSGIGMVVTLTGIPVYLLGVTWKSKPQWVHRAVDKCTVITQKILLSVPQDKED